MAIVLFGNMKQDKGIENKEIQVTFSNAECHAFQRDLNENKICGERAIKSKGMIISKVLNVMEQRVRRP